MAYHDPRREVEKFREILASPDLPLALLVGAGASCAVHDSADEPLVPAVAGLGHLCREAITALGTGHLTAYDAMTDELGARHPGRVATVEDLLNTVHRKIDALMPGQTLGGTTREQFEEIDDCMRRTIARAAIPEESRIPPRLPHHSLARWIGQIRRESPVEVFTTNYDTLLERGFDDEEVPYFDGFVGSRKPFFLPSTLLHRDNAPGRGWARLWKLHGSVTWRREHAPNRWRIVRGPEDADAALVFPALEKYEQSRKQPYVAMLDRLARFLEREPTALIAIGYSFGDQHINEVLFEALSVRPLTQVVALCYSDPDPGHEVVSRAYRNLTVYGSRYAVVGGIRGEWRLFDEITDREADLLDGPFETDAVVDPDVRALAGRFRLGDFNRLAAFLDSIMGDR